VKAGAFELLLGLFILALSILLWRLTENYWGWLVLFLPGAFYTFLGWVKVHRGY
jgi:hypothetical protein